MNLEELQKLADEFFEWPTEDRRHVTLTSTLLFARHVLELAAPRQAVEPAAFVYETTHGRAVSFNRIPDEDLQRSVVVTPLYAAPPAQQAEPVGFEYSRDYESLWEFVCSGGDALGFVDYRFLGDSNDEPPMRDPVRIKRRAPYQITFSARGISYGDITPFEKAMWPDEKELFLKACSNLNLEWAKPAQQPAPIPTGNCEWHDDEDGIWQTACGESWLFPEGGPSENGMKFCHSCGKHLVQAVSPPAPGVADD